MENANQRKGVKRKWGWPSDPDIIKPKIKCPNPNQSCPSYQDIEISNEGGTVIYKEGKNPFKTKGETSSGNKKWECRECNQNFTTAKDNINQITAESRQHITTPYRKSSLIERPAIKCPNPKRECPSYQDIGTFNKDGTVIYKEGKNPFNAHGEGPRGNKPWECKKCQCYFTTEKNNINQITAESQNCLKRKFVRPPATPHGEGCSTMPQYAPTVPTNQATYISLISPELDPEESGVESRSVLECSNNTMISETIGGFVRALEEAHEPQNSIEEITIDIGEPRNNQISPGIDIPLSEYEEFMKAVIAEGENKAMEITSNAISLEFIKYAPPSRVEEATIELNKPKKLKCPSVWSGNL